MVNRKGKTFMLGGVITLAVFVLWLVIPTITEMYVGDMFGEIGAALGASIFVWMFLGYYYNDKFNGPTNNPVLNRKIILGIQLFSMALMLIAYFGFEELEQKLNAAHAVM